jgi:Rrf2 family protein
MLKITKNLDYAFIILSHFAHNPLLSTSARALAEKYSLSKSLVAKILKLLSQHAILDSTMGPNGGYRLKADLDRITVKELVEEIEGPIQLTDCTFAGVNQVECELKDTCQVMKPMQSINDILVAIFEKVTLAQVSGIRKLPKVEIVEK